MYVYIVLNPFSDILKVVLVILSPRSWIFYRSKLSWQQSNTSRIAKVRVMASVSQCSLSFLLISNICYCLSQEVESVNRLSRLRIRAGETQWRVRSWGLAVIVQTESLWKCHLFLRQYRPIYISLPHMPQFNLRNLPPCSPFLAHDKDSPGKQQHPHRYRASPVWV